MDERTTTPAKLSFKGDLSANWKLWKQKFHIYLLATGKDTETDDVKIAILLHLMGDEGIEIYNTFEYEEGEDQEELNTVIDKFESYCNPIKNLVYEHFKFFKRCQLEHESISEYVTALRQLASTCEFLEKDILIRDRIVLGIRDRRIQEKLLETPNLSLADAIQIGRAMECSVSTQKIIQGEEATTSVDVVRKQRYNNTINKKSYNNQSHNQEIIKCSRCGKDHPKFRCPAFNRVCAKCKKRGHYREYCTTTQVHQISQGADTDSDNLDEDAVVWTIKGDINSIEWVETITINGCGIALKIDTGSHVNILNNSDFNKLSNCNLKPTSISLTSYTGHPVETLGQVWLKCRHRNVERSLLFYVLGNSKAASILGLNGGKELSIVRVQNMHEGKICEISTESILETFKSVFQGIGRVDREYKIKLSSEAIPYISAARKIPVAIKSKVKEKLDEMVKEGIIVHVDEPTDWVHPIVVAPKKNGDIRICMDPRRLNPFIKREHFHIATQDSLFSELAGSEVYSRLDASSAFLQVPLNHESSLVCTVATPFGRYRYLRLPYGISSAPEFFAKVMSEILCGIKGVIVYFDDVLIFAPTVQKHNEILSTVLDKFKKAGLTINSEKSSFCVTETKFLGHILSKNGISVDPEKTEAILKMNTPKNKKELQRFLGMVVYLAKFMPNLSQETNTLRNLLSNKAEWVWSSNEQKCFEQIKHLLTTSPVLKFFDPRKETTLSVDASPFGIGSVLLQDGHPIEYASISLNSCQQRYNHIEKELLAVVYGCQRFHYYLFGKPFIVETDHRPLLGVIKKPIDELSPRLQRLVFKLLRYQFELKYVPGKKLQLADSLSRDPTCKSINTNYLDENLRVYAVIATSKTNEERLKSLTREDETLQKIQKYAIDGWPNHKNSIPEDVKKYWQIKDNIYSHKDILFYDKRIIVPRKLRNEFLNLIHRAHQGVVACKKNAADTMYWPGISSEIEKLVLGCATCQEYSRSNPREPLNPHEVPEYPWLKVGIDFKNLGKDDFIVIADYFSKFVIVNKLSSKTATSVISALKNIFAINGIPLEIFSDNGPPFNSREFKDFAEKYDITLTTSSPHYPRSNGLVERHIQTVKSLLTKAIQDKQDPLLAVLNYNITPKNNLPAPCALLMGRRLRTDLPVANLLLKPNFSLSGVKLAMERQQNKAKCYYDKGSKALPSIAPNQPVLVQDAHIKRSWKPGVVIDKAGPNDFRVQVDNHIYRRNRSFLKPQQQTKINNSETETPNSPAKSKENNIPNPPLNSPTQATNNGVTTRSGRSIKAPQRLDI